MTIPYHLLSEAAASRHLPHAPTRRRLPIALHAIGLALASGALTVAFLVAVSGLVARLP